MAAWLMGITGAIVLTTLIDVIIAEGETKKYIKGIAALLIVAAVIAPLPKLLGSDFKMTFDSSSSGTTTDVTPQNENYLYRVYMERYKAYELSLQKQLKDAGIDGVTVRIQLNYQSGMVDIVSVVADASLAVITADGANININEEIYTVISKGLQISRSKIMIVGKE